ncbi:stomatin-like isoform 1-T1 [Anomaloglossus baeobatrachus]|uniref:stomatin-like isoform X1 n=1 Tax=Anomaloglossus baeobatrachus TaxID=238106 RepID=UPI003F4F8E49
MSLQKWRCGSWSADHEVRPHTLICVQTHNKVQPDMESDYGQEKPGTSGDKPASAQPDPGKKGVGCCGYLLIFFSFLLVLFTFPISLWSCIKIVQEYERAVIFRLGRVRSGAKGPGIFWILPCTDDFCRLDLRTVSFAVPPQEVLTKDSVTIMVDAVVFYRIFNPIVTVVKVDNANQATQMLAQTTLRNMLGTKSLTEILVDREEMADHMSRILYDATKEWGIKVERVEIKDVKLPSTLQRAMAAEAEAAREARAKVVAAEGEMNASRALKEAAVIMSDSPAALQLRYLQTLSHVAAEKNSTIIFPIPMEFTSLLSRS